MLTLSSGKAFGRVGATLCLLLCALVVPGRTLRAQQPTLVLQSGHHSNALALTPDGRMAITGGYDGLLKWWDRKTGLLMRTVVAHRGPISTVAFSMDGSRFMSGGVDGIVRIWDSERASKVFEFRVDAFPIEHAAFSPRGDMVALCHFGYYDVGKSDPSLDIVLWDARTGRRINVLRGHTSRVTYLDFNGAGDTLVSASEDKTLRVWSVATGELRNTIRRNANYGFVRLSSDGKTIAATSFSSEPTKSELVLFDARTGGLVRSISDNEYWGGKAISANWRYFVSTTGEKFKIWDLSSGQLVRLEQGTVYYSNVAINNDGASLALGTSSSPLFWPSAESQAPAPSLSSTTGLAVSRDRRLVAWAAGSKVYIWDNSNADLLKVLEGHSDSVNEVAFSPDGRLLVSTSNNEVKLWSIPDGVPQGDLAAPRLKDVEEYNWNGSQSVVFSPDGKYVATGEIRVTQLKQDVYETKLGVRIWNVATRQLIKRLMFPNFTKVSNPEDEKDPPYWIHSIAFSPDGRTIAADNGSNLVLLLDVKTEKARLLRGHEWQVNSVDFSPDGKRLVSAGFDKKVILWDVASARIVQTMRGHQARVTTVRFSPDGRIIVSGSLDRTLKLWDPKNGAGVATLENHNEAVTFVEVSSDGKTVLSTGLDGRVNMWSLPDQTLKATVVARSDKSWVCFTPEGYYKGSDSDQYLGWRIGNQMYPASAYRLQFSRPDLLVAKLNGLRMDTLAASPQPAVSMPPSPESRERGVGVRVRDLSGRTRSVQLYKRSYALLIGNSEYSNWNNLPGALQDMVEVRSALKQQGFEIVKFSEKGAPIFDQPALNLSRDEFKRQMELFIDEFGQDEENRLLVYYAGHGYTAMLPHGGKMGYLVMRDAPRMPDVECPLRPLSAAQLSPFIRASVNMDEIETFAKKMLSRHVMFVFDSCFAGTVLFRGGEPDVPPYITAEIIEPVREFMTAGNECQKVLDDSVFRKKFVQGIQGAADAAYGTNPRDGYVLASELYRYVKEEVVNYTRNKQTPVFGKIVMPELARGDFVFAYGDAGPNR